MALRDRWPSRVAFIYAAVGSAVGLGNIWRFPYVAGENGGAAFVFFYILFVILIGLPVMIAELSIGRNTRKNPVGAFDKLFPRSLWKLIGGLGVLTGIGILSFYSVIAGFTVGYFIKIIIGNFNQITTGVQSEEIFQQFASNPNFLYGTANSALHPFFVLTAFHFHKGFSLLSSPTPSYITPEGFNPKI